MTETHSLTGQSPGYFQGMVVYLADEAFSGPIFRSTVYMWQYDKWKGNSERDKSSLNYVRRDKFLTQRKQVNQLGKSLIFPYIIIIDIPTVFLTIVIPLIQILRKGLRDNLWCKQCSPSLFLAHRKEKSLDTIQRTVPASKMEWSIPVTVPLQNTGSADNQPTNQWGLVSQNC